MRVTRIRERNYSWTGNNLEIAAAVDISTVLVLDYSLY